MRNVVPLTQRELAASFFSPIAYVVGCVFLLFTGYYFVQQVLVPGNEASMRPLFAVMVSILVFALPLLTMRAVAEELSSGTIETLMTAPVSEAEVLLGKFIGVFAFYAVLLAATIPHLVFLLMFSHPNAGVIAFGYIGMLLIGAMFISVGLFASCCTRHQLLAAVIGMAVLSVFTFVVDFLADFAGPTLRRVLMAMNVPAYFDEFSKGILDTRALVFFVTTTAFFLFLGVKVLESKRWR